jgi:hypothetical protein
MRLLILLLTLTGFGAAFVTLPAYADDPFLYQPKEGFVPTAEVAIAIAIAVWTPIYGADQISREKPYHAELLKGVWYVSGSLAPNTFGGVAEAQISKHDGRVLGVIHGK